MTIKVVVDNMPAFALLRLHLSFVELNMGSQECKVQVVIFMITIPIMNLFSASSDVRHVQKSNVDLKSNF